MKIIFLDLDGVANTIEDYKREKYVLTVGNSVFGDGPPLNAAMVARVQKIAETAGAAIVLSTSWRLAPIDLVEYLSKNGITAPIIDQTPRLPGVTSTGRNFQRSDEIARWLMDHPEVESFVILDDMEEAGLGTRLVKTQETVGLQDEHVEEALAILARPMEAHFNSID